MSFWEAAILYNRGRLELSEPVAAWRREILDLGIAEIPVSGDIGIAAAELEDFHADPADRIIAATAMHRAATLITADARILDWPGQVNRHDARH